jgi:hypothetical protein
MSHDFVEKEAELQARLESRIRAALPLLPAKIKLERYLHLRLGHRSLTLDGMAFDKSDIQGRFDVLVLVEDTPLILAELKAPDVTVTDEDIGQALSYARLHQPLVPLVLVTNGTTTVLRRTYDGAELQASDVASDRLGVVLSVAAALAAATTEDAVRILLGASKEVWGKLLAAWSNEAIEVLTGGVREFGRPIPRGFVILRDAAQQVVDRLSGGARVVVLHGPPLSGVTNVLAQFARKSVAPVLLVDGHASRDVLQFIANRLSRELSIGVTKDVLRAWFNTRNGLLDVTLAIDGLPIEGVEELVEYANAALLRLVLGLGSQEYKDASTLPGRSQQSLLGQSGVPVELQPLSEQEFGHACEAFESSFGAYFHNGAQHIPDLRSPRRLRVIAATLPGAPALPPVDRRDTCVVIPPIPGPEMLPTYSQALAPDAALKYDLQKLAAAFLADADRHAGDPDWMAATWGRPSVDPAILEADLGETRIKRLCDLGFLSWVNTQSLGPRVLVRIEELLTCDVADIWAGRLAELADPDALKKEVRSLLDLTMIVPAGEVALAGAICRAAMKHDHILGTVVPYLMSQEPSISRLKQGARVDLLVKDARIRLKFGEGMDERVVGNMQPWVVLSHIASWPMIAEGRDATLNLPIFARLGASPDLLIYPRPIEPEIAAGFHFHEFPDVGPVLCLNTGIVEPLVQAMLSHAHRFPQEFEWLAAYAMEKKESHLGWRVLTVARAMCTSIHDEVAEAGKAVEATLDDWWKQFIQEAARQHSAPAEGDAVPLPVPKADRGEKLGKPASKKKAQPRLVTKCDVEQLPADDLAAGAKTIKLSEIPVERTQPTKQQN